MIIAWFLSIMVSWQVYPLIAGPYTLEECYAVREWLDRRGYDTDDCTMMSVEQEAVKLEVGYLP